MKGRPQLLKYTPGTADAQQRAAEYEAELARMCRDDDPIKWAEIQAALAVSLTEAAEHFYEGCARILDDLEALEADASAQTREPSGVLRLVAHTTATVNRLVPLISTFKRRHPKVSLDVTLTERPVDLVADGFDLGLVLPFMLNSDTVVTRLAGPDSRTDASAIASSVPSARTSRVSARVSALWRATTTSSRAGALTPGRLRFISERPASRSAARARC